MSLTDVEADDVVLVFKGVRAQLLVVVVVVEERFPHQILQKPYI